MEEKGINEDNVKDDIMKKAALLNCARTCNSDVSVEIRPTSGSPEHHQKQQQASFVYFVFSKPGVNVQQNLKCLRII